MTLVQEEFIGKEIARIREICGPKGRVIGAVSGGVDSSVAAKLMHEAIGDRYVVRGSFSNIYLIRAAKDRVDPTELPVKFTLMPHQVPCIFRPLIGSSSIGAIKHKVCSRRF